MSYTRDFGEISARYRCAGEVEQSILSASTVGRYVATGDMTNGQFGLFEWEMRPGAGARAGHFHKTFSESFYVTSGSVSLFNGETWITATKGDFFYVPQGGVHAYHNDSGSPSSMLVVFAPGAPREEYFRELARISAEGRQLSEDEWTELWARYDQYRA
ncbi:MAG TPA: cupin domain-containing protein [Streptosporangiaceae bacterium]